MQIIEIIICRIRQNNCAEKENIRSSPENSKNTHEIRENKEQRRKKEGKCMSYKVNDIY